MNQMQEGIMAMDSLKNVIEEAAPADTTAH